uniref:Uncharacterized protein n=1 Tax=Anguilla anguilla TaxID=7936 RepID=A0A0E9QPY2_ANGAN
MILPLNSPPPPERTNHFYLLCWTCCVIHVLS